MKRARSLPLGIDLGSTRIRVASVVSRGSTPAVTKVVCEALESTNATAIGAALKALLRREKLSERRAVFAVGEPRAILREARFPEMSRSELLRATRFEVARYIEYPVSLARVSLIVPSQHSSKFVVGALPREDHRRIEAIARAAGLRTYAIDHEALSYWRVFGGDSAVLDVGFMRSRLYVYGTWIPRCFALAYGSKVISEGIASALGVDFASAEIRKQTVGTAGAGDEEFRTLTRAIGNALSSPRGDDSTEVGRITIVGNGARLYDLARRLERDTGCVCEVASSVGIESTTYPPDILRANAADWALSVGNALWAWHGGDANDAL